MAISGLSSLLESRALRVLFQPIVDLDSLEVIGYESLARGPVGSPLELPAELFTSARAEGLLEALDNACRAQAFRSAITSGLLAPLTLFVNVEPEVLDGAPLGDLLQIAATAPGELQVAFEITERAVVSRPAELLRTVDRIREHGWSVALDDVGADPASLAFMSLLRPEVVKLDLRLIQRRPTPEIAKIMHAVNAYTEKCGALLLAEGIENELHLEAARALGAHYGQGWFFGRPSTDQSTLPVRGVSLPHVPLWSRGGVVAAFQSARYFSDRTAERYARLADEAAFVFVLGAGISTEPAAGVRGARLELDDPVLGEWGVVVIAPHFAGSLLARELPGAGPEQARLFEYALTYRRDFVTEAACELLSRALPAEPQGSSNRQSSETVPAR